MNKNFNKKMMVMITIVGSIALVGCNNNESLNKNTNTNQNKIEQTSNKNNTVKKTKKIDLLLELNNAKEVTVKEKLISIGSGYDIYADDKHVGEIQGKYINITGDVFELKDLDGNVIKSEKQIKRWNMKLNRMAEVYDKDKNVSGYIGEEKIKDMFSWGYKFHFYNKNKDEIGYTDQQIFSMTDTYKVYDLGKNLDYEIKGEFLTLTPSFEIAIHDTSNIPVEDVVFYTAIQNEISKSNKAKKKDEEKKKNSSISETAKNVAVAKVVNDTVNNIQKTQNSNNNLSSSNVVSLAKTNETDKNTSVNSEVSTSTKINKVDKNSSVNGKVSASTKNNTTTDKKTNYSDSNTKHDSSKTTSSSSKTSSSFKTSSSSKTSSTNKSKTSSINKNTTSKASTSSKKR